MSTKVRLVAALVLLVSMFSATIGASAQENGNNDDNGDNGAPAFEVHGYDFHEPEFYDVWARTDLPVLQGEVERSWLWGPAANTPLIEEPYAEADDDTREVQYSDKSRMEMPVPGSAAASDDDDSPWNITQGLLATELMTGQLQLGDDTFEQYEPAEIPVAGDWENNPGPTYADMAQYMDYEARNTGWTITQYFDEDGVVQDDDRFAEYGVYDRYYIPETDHNIASVFWDFMQSEGLVYDNGDLENGPIFQDEFYAIGFPTTEAYWGEFRLRGEVQDILVQCFERRCLTYAPDNPAEWQVESGNIGLHYFNWRYNIIDQPVPELALALAQDEDTNDVGTEHEFTATLTEDDEARDIDDADDVTVEVERDGSAVDFEDGDLDVQVDDNVATISYTGPDAPATDEIDVSVDVDGTEVAGEPTLTKNWVEPEAPTGTFTYDGESSARVEVGEDVTLTAHVEQDGEDLEGAEVYFWSNDDPDIISLNPYDADTGADGTAEVTVTGVAEGDATVNAFVDQNGDGVFQDDEDIDLGSVDIEVVPAAPELTIDATEMNRDVGESGIIDSTLSNPSGNDGGVDYASVRNDIIVDGPADCEAGDDWTDWFEITGVDGGPTEGINDTFECDEDSGNFVGFWGPETGFALDAGYQADTEFEVMVANNAPAGTYTVTTELVDLDADVTLASASDDFDITND